MGLARKEFVMPDNGLTPRGTGGLWSDWFAIAAGELVEAAVWAGWSVAFTRPAMGGRTVVKLRMSTHSSQTWVATVNGRETLEQLEDAMGQMSLGQQLEAIKLVAYREEGSGRRSW